MRGKKLSPATIRKEIVTLRTAWNWGVQMGLLDGRFSIKGLRYPRVNEKPPFMVWEEVERRIMGLTEEAAGEWWDCLYLRGKEISELLTHVKTKALQPWVHPLCCVAAYTGARRAEMLRMLVSDVDFQGNTMVIREKKRTKGKTTTRRVPLTPFLLAFSRNGWPCIRVVQISSAKRPSCEARRSGPLPCPLPTTKPMITSGGR